jgi:hypothetical protein
MRLAQYRRKLPQFGPSKQPPQALSLTGPFRTPVDWDSERRKLEHEPPPTANPMKACDAIQPRDYLQWLDTIPLAISASRRPLKHFTHVARDRMQQRVEVEDSF